MESETLFYQCCERVCDMTDKDISFEVSEKYVADCIHYLFKKQGVKESRVKIKEQFKSYNFDPYIRQLRYITVMHDDIFKALLTSSLYLRDIERQIEVIWELSKDASFDLVDESTHCNIAKRISSMMTDIHSRMKPNTRVKTDCSLF